MKKLRIALLLFLFAATRTLAQTPEADKILGVWLSEDKTGKIDVYKVNGKYFGKLIWGKTIYEADGTTSRKDVYLTCYNAYVITGEEFLITIR